MAKITVTLQALDFMTCPAVVNTMHQHEVRLQVLPKPGDYIKNSEGYAEVVRVVHDINTSKITLVIK